MMPLRCFITSSLAVAAALLSTSTRAENISFHGNAYTTSGEARRTEAGIVLERPADVCSIFFHVDRASDLKLSLKADLPDGEAVIRASVGAQDCTAALKAGEASTALGSFRAGKAGYVRVDFTGVSKTGSVFAIPNELIVQPSAPETVVSHVKDNVDNRHYWGRRGPSVHLTYSLPQGRDTEWFYNEVIMPEGMDPAGSYCMANGFGEGYFGMQVNSATERRILFSVWSPFQTDDPKSIPQDQRITLLAKGKGVRVGEFGNEGSGGQSFLIYPWKAGTVCCFLNRARPDGKGGTVYTGWFCPPETNQWQLIASFRRPQTDKHLTGVHSFLENFIDANGWLAREARYGNQWACDTTGQWHALTHAKFTGDDIARRGYRLDYTGGTHDGVFFLKNGGFFPDTTRIGSSFTRNPGQDSPPRIDLEKLEGVDSSR